MNHERENFRKAVFERDGYRCVSCGEPAVDAHHLLERRLWDDGGYRVNNGVSLCGECHLLAEKTILSVEDLRAAAGITKREIPNTLYRDAEYDKWGNEIIASGVRIRGPLYHESIKVVPHTIKFNNLYKYPRTRHLPWSPAKSQDDIYLTNEDIKKWEGREMIVTEKMDGENTTMYREYIHARSIESSYHESRTWVKNFWAERVAYQIPDGMRVVGENLYAVHSIKYTNLPSYFLGFGMWEEDTCMSWDTTIEWFDLLGIMPVREIMRGVFDIEFMVELSGLDLIPSEVEGYVIRPTHSFRAADFDKLVGKVVRLNHVTTARHWKHSQLDINGLA